MGTDLDKYIKDNEKIKCTKCNDVQYKYEDNKRVPCECVSDLLEGGYKEHLKRREITEGFKQRYLPSRLHELADYDYNPEELKSTDNEIYNWEVSFNAYKRILKGIYNSLTLGKIITKNHLIVAPKGYGKTDFVYYSMIRGFESGLNVSKLISIKEVTMKIHQKDYSFLEDLFTSKDIIFLNLGRHVDYEDIKSLQYLLDISERKETPIIVISNLPLKALVIANGSFATDVNKTVKSGYFSGLQLGGFSDEQMIEHYKKNIKKTKTNRIEKTSDKEQDLLDIDTENLSDKLDADEEFDFKKYKDSLKETGEK